MKTFNDYEMLDVKKGLVIQLRNKAERLKKSFEQYDYTTDEIKQTIDDTVGEFMRDKWDAEWEDNDQALAFYENTACPARIDLEYEMIDLYKELNQ